MFSVRQNNSAGGKKPSVLIALSVIGVVIVSILLMANHRIAAERRPIGSSPLRIDPRLGITAARIATKIHSDSLIFSGDKFPTLQLVRPARIEDRLGKCRVTTLFFDRNYHQVQAPSVPGPYGAVVTIQPNTGHSTRHYLTLYRTKLPLPPDSKFDPGIPAILANAVGVPVSVIERETKLINKRFRDRSFHLLMNDQAAARVLAGLSLSSNPTTPSRPWNDAEAAEHRWWVEWKRKSLGLADQHSRSIMNPRPVPYLSAPVIREGTLTEAGMKPDVREAIDSVLTEWAGDSDQAFAVCIVRKGVIVFHQAYGTRDGKPMTVQTKSWMASVTKPMSASLMMMLVDDGLLTLDDRIVDLLPQLHGLKTDRPITVRHLYTHTHNLEFWLKGQDELPDFEERVADVYPSAHAGRIWNYNGIGYTLGGKIIEDLTGESLPDFYRKHLLEPLGMDDTDVTGTHADARSIPLDIAKFGQMLLNRGAYGDLQFFRESTFQTMLPKTLTTVLGPETKKAWGIGLDGDPNKIGHGAASAAIFRVDRHNELVVVMTREKRGKNYDKYEPRFWDAIRQGIR